ncbi:hypothetical protein ABD87_22670 [Lysinibacillus sphaericus]|uniref:hypothetical protein n=1 Tax=Lysinibacillus sphaericus TaxID=1421 RepID=UPI0018CF341E|nr:hypothetical protein [Lysinibacillus sphaericus]MBG9732231.1 hypothetical protein [Lysinibacillus sphaericus]
MGRIRTVMLSDLADDVIVSYKDATYTMTVKELKEELKSPDYTVKKWYVVKWQTWKPDTREMLEDYIKKEFRDMYEGWDSKAMDCITDDVMKKMQSVLDEAFKSPSVRNYWTLDRDKQIYI